MLLVALLLVAPHVGSLPAHAQTNEAVSLIQQINKLYGEKRYAEATPLALRLLTVREAELGPDHLEVAALLNILANLYQDQGRFTNAEPLFKRSLAINEKALGPSHSDVALSLNNLALLYRIQGRYADA